MDSTGTSSGYTVLDTRGSSATQIIEAAGLGKGNERFGLTIGARRSWVASVA